VCEYGVVQCKYYDTYIYIYIYPPLYPQHFDNEKLTEYFKYSFEKKAITQTEQSLEKKKVVRFCRIIDLDGIGCVRCVCLCVCVCVCVVMCSVQQ
jgi:hypothetical protein